jgi:hypothetical protein
MRKADGRRGASEGLGRPMAVILAVPQRDTKLKNSKKHLMMTSTEPLPIQDLQLILSHHGLHTEEYNGWLLANGNFPAIRAQWTPGLSNGRLDIHLRLESGSTIEESFAGIGEGQTGIRNGLHNFMLNSLHVMLAGFWQIVDGDQVSIESWEIAGKKYTSYCGNFGTRASDGIAAEIPQGALAAIEKAILNENLSSDTHWIRTFFANLNGQFTIESLLDNEAWRNGEAAVSSLPWKACEGYYSVRQFILLRSI